MKLKKNQLLTLCVEDITNLGFGVAKVEGAVVFISGAVPGDTVRVRIIKEASSYYIARLEELITPSDIRVSGRCDSAKCRACAYREIDYAHELSIKQGTVKAAFAKAGLPEVFISDAKGSPKLSGYRNKAQYPISKNASGEYVIGFYAPKSHNVCEAAHCPMAPEIFGDILEELRGFFKEYSLSVYNEATGEGLLRHVYLRRAEIGGEILLTLVLSDSKLPGSDSLTARICDKFPDVKGILINVNRENTNVILGDEYITLSGRDHIYDTLAGVRLKLTAPAFYQVNRGAAELLYAKARELARLDPSDTLLDLYCGAGSIGLSMAKDAKEVIGIEIVDSAVECATINAISNALTNARFFTGDAADCERLLENAERIMGKKLTPDVIILDPPRAGCDERLLRFINTLNAKRIVYISCNPSTLARDVAIMKKLGFAPGEVTPFDLFPMTGHVESVVCLTRTFNN